jgi:hypothetical protein
MCFRGITIYVSEEHRSQLLTDLEWSIEKWFRKLFCERIRLFVIDSEIFLKTKTRLQDWMKISV